MNHAFKPLQNTSLPHVFRQIRLERAREPDHPEGAPAIAYVMIAPLDMASRIDVGVWHGHKEACRIVRQRPDEEEWLGHLVHGRDGNWRFHYDVSGLASDEAGYHFADERFRLGEYVSVREEDGIHPYRVAGITPL